MERGSPRMPVGVILARLVPEPVFPYLHWSYAHCHREASPRSPCRKRAPEARVARAVSPAATERHNHSTRGP